MQWSTVGNHVSRPCFFTIKLQEAAAAPHVFDNTCPAYSLFLSLQLLRMQPWKLVLPSASLSLVCGSVCPEGSETVFFVLFCADWMRVSFVKCQNAVKQSSDSVQSHNLNCVTVYHHQHPLTLCHAFLYLSLSAALVQTLCLEWFGIKMTAYSNSTVDTVWHESPE